MSNIISIDNVADWFLSQEPMTHKKLQKLCYYAVAWGWALMNRQIASNGRFEAWVHGPVSPKLYRKYKSNGWNNLPQPDASPAMPVDILELLEAVWVTYGSKSGNELEALSHAERPWQEARGGLPVDATCKEEIDGRIMREYYNSIKSTDY